MLMRFCSGGGHRIVNWGNCYWWEVMTSGKFSFMKRHWLDGILGFGHKNVGIALDNGI
jgi:hypothetical protein